MSDEVLREKLTIHIDRHPFYESINKRIEEELAVNQTPFVYDEDSIWKGYKSNIKGWKASLNNEYKSIKLLEEWILSLVKDKCWGINCDIESWIAKYDEGHYTIDHDHIPATYSFVYFLKCPKGSSPLVFTTSGKKIKAEEGKIVIFPGCVRHYVPKNKGNGRMTFSGNLFYVDP